jgi:hypothetical protein
MKPSHKSPEITKLLDHLSDRTNAIKHRVCIQPPIGCGVGPVTFRDGASMKEYTISGLCQACQDLVFGE